MEESNRKKVDFITFTWAIGVMVVIMGVLFSMVTNTDMKVDGYQDDISDIKVEVKEVSTDVKWIKQNLQLFEEVSNNGK
jgi:hypothetical protein|tara:strand:+ start:276 stop:512 length:237 start_codon:yes stop_codon:yes gene_type:complete